jgi:hypothetical protein
MTGIRVLVATLLLSIQTSGHFGHLVFEKNKGQAPADALYLLRAPAYELDFKRGEIAVRINSTAFRVRFAGPVRKPTPEGHARLDGLIRYINEPEDKREIPIFASLRYESLYAGIDLLFYPRKTDLKTEFVVASGSDPQQIQLAIEGADRIEIDETGNLVFETPSESLRLKHPIAFQPSRGRSGTVDVDYQLSNSNEIGFAIGPYDRTQLLTILIPTL